MTLTLEKGRGSYLDIADSAPGDRRHVCRRTPCAGFGVAWVAAASARRTALTAEVPLLVV